MQLHEFNAAELGDVGAFMWASRDRFGDKTTAEKAEAFLRMFKQGKLTIRKYSTEFQRQAVKIRNWTDPVLAQQYRLGLAADIRNNVMSAQNPRTLLAWMQEAESAESRLRAMRLDTAATSGRPLMTVTPRAKTGTTRTAKPSLRDQRMKQGLCLKCEEGGHFAANCLWSSSSGGTPKEGDKCRSVSFQKKSTAKPRSPRALQ
ncbi:UNVERIFIED_CONTAM: hypothetical protein K2H54_067366, partial [Gekko kuhli]